jgi:hypothetical protein
MNIPTGSSPHLENLIDAYSAAIWSLPFSGREELAALCRAVEREAGRINYQDNLRLKALHDAAERMLEVA